MTDEDCFQAALDANPDDHVTRLAFADWLEERGDQRAEGYRALGLLRKHAAVPGSQALGANGGCWFWVTSVDPATALPIDWQRAWRPLVPKSFVATNTRRRIEDAAALGFAKLSVERRAVILKTPVGEPVPVV